MINVRYRLQMLSAMLVAFFVSTPAFAQVDTATDSLTGIQDWLEGWIPLACFLAIVACGLGWMFNMLRLDLFLRLAGGMILIGSASYLVSLFGL